MTDPIWWPSKPDDADAERDKATIEKHKINKMILDKWLVKIGDVWDMSDVESQPSAMSRSSQKEIKLAQMFSPSDQTTDIVQVGEKDGIAQSWVVSDTPNLDYDDSRTIFDNTEDFV